MPQAPNNTLACINGLTTYNSHTLSSDMEAFLAVLNLKGRRPTTIRTYREVLKSVFRTLEADYGSMPDPRTISASDFQYLRTSLKVCDNSKKLYLLVLGLFVEFLTGYNPRREAGILWNDDDRKRKFISPDQFRMMMYRADPLERLILSLGAYMGLRRSEIAGIRMEDIQGGHLIVRGKGHGPDGKVARLFIPVQVQRCMDAWMVERGRILGIGDGDPHLLLTVGKNPGRCMSGNRIGEIVKKLGGKCGVDLTAHSLRRLFCTTMWSAGVDANTVRLMMRHQSIDTTMRCYILSSPEQYVGARKALEALD